MAEDQRNARIFGAVDVLVIPEFLWELSLGIYAAVWGFRRDAPILSASARS